MPQKKAENIAKFGQNVEDRLDEWEKNQVKELYQKLDKDKKATLAIDDYVTLFEQLKNDEAIMGKVPAQDIQEIRQVLESAEFKKRDDGKIGWI